MCLDGHIIHKKRPYGLSIMIVILITDLFAGYHTHLVMPNRLCSPHSSQTVHRSELYAVYRTHLDLVPVFVVLSHRKQFVQINCMPFIAHATKTWTVFDASVIANVLYISDGFHTTPFAIIASHTVSRRVSDHSVALAASCSSGD